MGNRISGTRKDAHRQSVHTCRSAVHIIDVDMDFTDVKSFSLKNTDVVFDSEFHPDKEGVLAVATIEGHVHM